MYPYQVNKKRIVVVGGNAAGAAAAAKAKRYNHETEVVLIEAGEYISVGSCEMPYLISGEIPDYKKIVFFNADSFREKKGVDVFLGHKVMNILPSKRFLKVQNENGNEYQLNYDKLIIATGSKASKPSQISNCDNVYTFKTINDYLEVKKAINKSVKKQVLVIGGGFIGLEISEALSKIGFKVLLIEQKDSLMPNFEPELRLIINDVAVKNGIRVFTGNPNVKYSFTNTDLKTEGNTVSKVSIDGYSFDLDFIISAIGFTPNTDLARDAKLSIGTNGIKVNSKMQTSEHSIYAAGDCCEVINFLTKRSDYLPLATIARNGGYVAGENAAGGNQYFTMVIANISLSFFDYFFTSTGITESRAIALLHGVKTVTGTANSLVEVMPESSKVYGKIVINRENEIIGGSFFGGKEVSGLADIIAFAIRKKSKLRELSELNFNYTPKLSPFTNILSILSKKGS